MDNLAPEIARQRQLIEGFFAVCIDEEQIRSYFDRLTSALHLRTYTQPTIFAPAERAEATTTDGYNAFVPLIDSGISLYAWNGPRFLSVVIFTCTWFDAAIAVTVTRQFFRMPRLATAAF